MSDVRTTVRKVYSLPSSLGGQQVRLLGHTDGNATVDAGELGRLTVPWEWLTVQDVPLREEPAIGSIEMDTDGDPWKRKAAGWVNSPSGTAVEWADLQDKWGPTRPLYLYPDDQPPAARTPPPAVPIDTDPLPLRLVCADGRRELVIETGKLPGDIRFQTIEGDFHSRAAVLDNQSAQRAAWAILGAVAR